MSSSIAPQLSPTPDTTSAANGSGAIGKSPSTSAGFMSLASASYSSSSARSLASRRDPLSATSGPGDVLARTGVDLDAVARVDEQRHLHDSAGLSGSRFLGAGHSVALHARFGLGNRQLDRGRQIDTDNFVLVHLQHRGVAVLQIQHRVAQGRGLDVHLVVGGVVHEDVMVFALAVEQLHLALVDDCLLELLVGAVGATDDGACAHVLELRSNERAALARLDVLELDDLEQALGQVERHAVLQVVGRNSHQSVKSFGAWVRRRAPSSVTTRVS